MTLRLAESGYQVNDARVFVVGLSGVVGLDFLETADVFRVDQGRLAAQATGRLQQGTFVAAG